MKLHFVKKMINGMTGREDILRKNLSVVYTGEKLITAVKQYRIRLLKRYAAAGAITVVLIIAAFLSSYLSDRSISSVVRPAAGSPGMTLPVTVQGEYRGHTVESTENLNITAAVLSEKQKKKKLLSFSKKLPDRIAPADQDGLRLVTDNINLLKMDEKTGIEMRWESSDPAVLSEEGKLNVIPMESDCETITLSVTMILENISEQMNFDVFVRNNAESYDVSVKNQIHSVAGQVSEIEEGGTIVLPEESEGGMKLKWYRRENSFAILILAAGMLLFFCIYAGRYDRAKNNARKYQESVAADFPAVVDKLVLLLNSGLTVFSALMRISGDYADETQDKASPAAMEIAAIGQRVQNTNSSVIDEWKQFAIRMESSDILRFCTILEDNMSKGSELSMKLENESEELRELRKKNIQKYIRTIDSKMMIPMMMMLCSLVLVTVAPVITGF